MTRIFALLVTVTATAIALAADELPRNESDEPESFDIEPAPLIQNRRDEQLSATRSPGDLDVGQLEKQLDRAKKNASGAERLYKIGVLAKVEVEQRALKVVRLESDLAHAQLARAKAELAAKESQPGAGEITSKDELEAAKAAVTQLTEGAQIAAAKRERAELEAAEANLRRQEKLLRLGSAHKSDVNRAQEKLAELKTPKN
jgi:hypothetical protein